MEFPPGKTSCEAEGVAVGEVLKQFDELEELFYNRLSTRQLWDSVVGKDPWTRTCSKNGV